MGLRNFVNQENNHFPFGAASENIGGCHLSFFEALYGSAIVRLSKYTSPDAVLEVMLARS